MLNEELKRIDDIIANIIEPLLPDNELGLFISNGSKKIRSKLAILYVKSHFKELNDDIYKLLAAAELIHNASLLHDDVIDDANLRRGRTTLSKKYSPYISILCGDYVVSKAVDLLNKINNAEIIGIFNNCIKNMAASEINQYFLRGKLPDKEEYINICNGKTAGLFSAILESCAIMLSLNRDDAVNFGKVFGIYFQLKNDMSEASTQEDTKNKIATAKSILGIENAIILLDNYNQELSKLISKLPNNEYRKELEGIIRGL